MIDKKQLIEDLLECVNDATDRQTAMTGMTMCAILMNEVIDQALILPDVSQRSELLPEFLMHDLDGKIITSVIGSADVTKEWNEYLGNCG